MASAKSAPARVREPMTESRSPSADGRVPSTDSRAPAAAEPAPLMPRAAAAKASVQPIPVSSSSPTRTFAMLAAILAACAAAVIYGKKRRTAHPETAGIELISVKSLGGKQRLAVIDACGDRLLIATSEQGVQLLSKLEGGTGVHKLGPDFLATLQQAEAASAVPTTHVTQVNTSKDLAGLVSLRARRATWASSEPLV